MKKNVLHAMAILMALCLVISCDSAPTVNEKVWDGTTSSTEWYTGAADGTTEYTIKTAADLVGLAKLVNDAESPVDFSGKTIKLDADLDLNNKSWTPIGNADSDYTVGSLKYKAFKGTFDGQNHTIKNLKVDSTAVKDGYYASALFGWAHTGSEIKNLNIDTATVDGHHYVAAIVGYLYSGQVTDCTVKNAILTNTHANDDACGDKTGAIVGIWQNSDGKTMKNSSATDCTIKGSRDAGKLVGATDPARIDTTTCSATNVTVSKSTGECNHAWAGLNIRDTDDLYGRDLTKNKIEDQFGYTAPEA
jgi:hypothetical protein